MGNYLGLLLVLVVGVVAIGLVYTQANLLEQDIAARSASVMSAGVIKHIQKEKVVLKFGPFSYVLLTDPVFPSYIMEYRKKDTFFATTVPTTFTTPSAPMSAAKPTPQVPATQTPSNSPASPKPSVTPTPTPVANPTPQPVNSTPTPTTEVPEPTVAPTPAPTASADFKWGVFSGDTNNNLGTFESMVGKKADIQAIFLSWNDDFPNNWFGRHLCPERELLIFWENSGISLDDIIAGKYDTYVKRFSDGAQVYGCPIILSPFHEMNGNWDTWGGMVGNNTPAKVVAAWKRIHDRIPATNIKWAWAINNDSVPNVPENAAHHYWPGSAYVDYVGVDGFSFGERWETFGEIFDEPIADLQKYNKPIYIFSMGADADTRKAAWITEALGTHVKTYKNFAGWVWFNHNKGDGNWSVNSDPASLTAFKAVLP